MAFGQTWVLVHLPGAMPQATVTLAFGQDNNWLTVFPRDANVSLIEQSPLAHPLFTKMGPLRRSRGRFC